MQVPADIRYSVDHGWAARHASVVRVGITDYAQDALGELRFVQLPTLGSACNAGDVLGEVESSKSVSEVYAPIRGTVVAVNNALVDEPSLINSDPYAAGWICDVRPEADDAVDGLLDASAYLSLTEE